MWWSFDAGEWQSWLLTSVPRCLARYFYIADPRLVDYGTTPTKHQLSVGLLSGPFSVSFLLSFRLEYTKLRRLSSGECGCPRSHYEWTFVRFLTCHMYVGFSVTTSAVFGHCYALDLLNSGTTRFSQTIRDTEINPPVDGHTVTKRKPKGAKSEEIEFTIAGPCPPLMLAFRARFATSDEIHTDANCHRRRR